MWKERHMLEWETIEQAAKSLRRLQLTVPGV